MFSFFLYTPFRHEPDGIETNFSATGSQRFRPFCVPRIRSHLCDPGIPTEARGPKRKVGRAPCRACCLPQSIHPGQVHTPQELFCCALLGQRARGRLHHAGYSACPGSLLDRYQSGQASSSGVCPKRDASGQPAAAPACSPSVAGIAALRRQWHADGGDCSSRVLRTASHIYMLCGRQQGRHGALPTFLFGPRASVGIAPIT